ncbi:MAG: efflux RND transporter periplasmic adaptor subunit, partial [Gemmataceae bacterium]
MKRLLIWLLILGVLAGVGAAAVKPLGAWWQKRTEPRYLTAAVSRGRVETVVNSTGTVKPVLSVSVGAFTSGPIKEIRVDFNSPVKKGDLIALIDPMLAEASVARDSAALDAQKADLQRSEALLKQAENNERRATQLQAVKKDFLSDTDMDTYHFTRLQQEAAVALSKAMIKQAEAQLNNSKTNLGYCQIRSPVDGIVIERRVDPGQTVQGSFQTPELFIIAPEMDKHMFVYASVDEADIGLIGTAQDHKRPVKFTVDAYGGDLFEGTIHQIRKNSTTTQNVVTYPVVIEAPNHDLKLMPGMTANISFQIEEKENVMRVPVSALRFVPLVNQVRPEDRKHVVPEPSSDKPEATTKTSASTKAEQARKRQHRIVWIQDGPLLRAVPVTLGLIDNQYAE